jgi:hypothetical protein
VQVSAVNRSIHHDGAIRKASSKGGDGSGTGRPVGMVQTRRLGWEATRLQDMVPLGGER